MRARLPVVVNGWGGRDRTYECRNQNPVPYHLATPQRKPNIVRNRSSRRSVALESLSRHANAASGCRASVRATHPRIVCGSSASASCASRSVGKGGEHARARSRHPRLRRCAQQCLRSSRPRQEIATPSRPRGHCAHNPRKRRLFSPTASCVSIRAPRRFRRCGTRHRREREREPSTAAARPASARRRCRARRAFSPPTKNGTSAPSARARCAASSARGRCEIPQPIEREQHARGVGAAAAQPAAERNALVDDDRRRRARATGRAPAAHAPRAPRDRSSSGTPATSPCRARSRRRRVASSVIVSARSISASSDSSV